MRLSEVDQFIRFSDPPGREDRLLAAWYRFSLGSLRAERASKHRTAGIDSRDRRRDGCVAACGTRAAVGETADHRVLGRSLASRSLNALANLISAASASLPSRP